MMHNILQGKILTESIQQFLFTLNRGRTQYSTLY